VNIIIDSTLGPVPVELDEMYPFAQSVFPVFTDEETERTITSLLIFYKTLMLSVGLALKH